MKETQKIIIFNLLLIFCLTAFLKVKAAESDSTTLSLKIATGSLSVSAPESATLAETNFSFEGQTSSTNNPINNIQTTDARGSRAGWGINITPSDWSDSANPEKTIKYNGSGDNEGHLSLDIPDITEVTKLAGDEVSGMSMGIDDSFDATTSYIKLITAAPGSGSGQYDISGLNASQYIPGNQPMGDYVTNLVLTIS